MTEDRTTMPTPRISPMAVRAPVPTGAAARRPRKAGAFAAATALCLGAVPAATAAAVPI